MRDARLWLNGKMLPLRRAGVGPMETENGVLTAPRYIETLNGRDHAIFKLPNEIFGYAGVLGRAALHRAGVVRWF